MSHGGARARSGPAPDPNSGRSDRLGLTFLALPPEGYDGEIPDFPLPDSVLASMIAERESAIWTLLWSLPQGLAWSLEPWRHEQVALYCRLKATVEVNPTASAALITQMIRMEDRIGLSDDGMRRNGWQIAPSAPAESAAKAKRSGGSRNRFKVVPGGAAS